MIAVSACFFSWANRLWLPEISIAISKKSGTEFVAFFMVWSKNTCRVRMKNN
jgi:hypothetical protein